MIPACNLIKDTQHDMAYESNTKNFNSGLQS